MQHDQPRAHSRGQRFAVRWCCSSEYKKPAVLQSLRPREQPAHSKVPPVMDTEPAPVPVFLGCERTRWTTADEAIELTRKLGPVDRPPDLRLGACPPPSTAHGGEVARGDLWVYTREEKFHQSWIRCRERGRWENALCNDREKPVFVVGSRHVFCTC